MKYGTVFMMFVLTHFAYINTNDKFNATIQSSQKGHIQEVDNFNIILYFSKIIQPFYHVFVESCDNTLRIIPKTSGKIYLDKAEFDFNTDLKNQVLSVRIENQVLKESFSIILNSYQISGTNKTSEICFFVYVENLQN